MSFLGEIKRRKVFQVAAVYLVVAWLIMQVVDVVNEPLSLPDWFDTVAILLLAIGFPIAVITSWAFDLTPDGVVRDTGSTVAAQSSGRRIEYVFTALLVVAVGTLLYREFSPTGPLTSGDALPNSVAVLPFENLSPDPDNAYFAAGIHESTLNQLAKIRDLSVIARTSVMQYEDDPPPIPEIAEALKVEMVMEGSVRYANDRVLITAQLIDGQTGAHLWSKEYDRDLTDIFAIQSEIATQIAMALEAELLPSERESIERPPTDSFDAYASYVRALELRSSMFDSAQARATMGSYLDQAIELDPEFALAYAAKADYYVVLMEANLGSPESWLARRAELKALAREAAETALRLDPRTGFAEAQLGWLDAFDSGETVARRRYERALEFSPNHPETLNEYAYFNAYTDQAEAASRLLRRAIELDPNNRRWKFTLSDVLALAGDIDGAIESARAAVATDPNYPLARVVLGVLESVRGNHEEAIEELRILESQLGQAASPSLYAELAYGYARVGLREDAERVVGQLEQIAAQTHVGAGTRALASLALGDEDEVLRRLDLVAADFSPDEGFFEVMAMRANYWADPILEQPEFVEVRSRLGFRE